MEENQKKTKRISHKEMEEITRGIDEKLHQFIKEGRYKEVLMMMGNLGNYSLNNQIYIIMQRPDARTVHGMKKWNSLGRHVNPGEKSIKIFSPILVKKKDEEKEQDAGEPKSKGYICKGFKLGYVFDISQTSGRELSAFRFDETELIGEKEKILKALADVVSKEGFTIRYASKEELGDGCYGLCNHLTHEIEILEGMSDLQEISTTVHECGHALAHSAYRKDFDGLTPQERREIKEVEAESIACVVCTYLGLDTQDFNFSYITGWAEGDITKFRKNLDVISRHAKTLIDGIERERSKENQKEHEIGDVPIEIVSPRPHIGAVME